VPVQPTLATAQQAHAAPVSERPVRNCARKPAANSAWAPR
jgi:hypothetical protein